MGMHVVASYGNLCLFIGETSMMGSILVVGKQEYSAISPLYVIKLHCNPKDYVDGQ